MIKGQSKKKCAKIPKTSETPSSSTTQEMEQQFEMELCWCIQQLQTALRLGKLNPKQVQDHTKALNTLMSHGAPAIKKRQVMRLSFGDYREKMAQEERKQKKINLQVKPATPSKKSTFVRKATNLQSGEDNVKTEQNFKFNFVISKEV